MKINGEIPNGFSVNRIEQKWISEPRRDWTWIENRE